MEMFVFATGILCAGIAALWVAIFGIDIRITHYREGNE